MSNPFRLASAVAHTEGDHLAGRRHTTEGRIVHHLLKQVYESHYLLTLVQGDKVFLYKSLPNVGAATRLMPTTGEVEVLLYTPTEEFVGSLTLRFGESGGNNVIADWSHIPAAFTAWLEPVCAYARRA